MMTRVFDRLATFTFPEFACVVAAPLCAPAAPFNFRARCAAPTSL